MFHLKHLLIAFLFMMTLVGCGDAPSGRKQEAKQSQEKGWFSPTNPDYRPTETSSETGE